MKLKLKTEKMVDVHDWDDLVSETYGRLYTLQQQGGCHQRGTICLTVPDEGAYDFENDTCTEECNGPDEGVSFKAWLERDPKQPLVNQEHDFELDIWWRRNFYPCIEMVANDLHAQGLLDAGEYMINIDW